ncbi:MAG: Ectoine hydrolase [Acidimicrobiaceae bacterium]|nr:Ectoine hydrolase [Acidimicrobiaceae bacterium]
MPADVSLPFSRAEYQERLNRTRTAMANAGIDVLFVADPSNMCWLTGFDAWSFYTYQGVVVSLDQDPIYWGRQQDTNAARRTTWIDNEQIVPYPENFVQTPERHPMEKLGELFGDRGFADRRIGVELDNYYYSAAADRALRSTLGRDDLVDATGLVNWQRAVKSPRELEYMRIAGSILEAVFERVRETIRPGIRKSDLVAEIYHTMIGGTSKHGGDYPAIVPLLPTGADAAASHLTWNDLPMERGAGTFLELAGCYRRYHATLCRSVFLGEPPAEFLNGERALMDGLEAGIEAARPGNRAADVAIALNETLAQYGIDRGGARCGYPIGLSYPPDWGERTISFRPTDDTILEPGMTFHFMPGLWMDDWGLEITESIVIADSGPAECLVDVPRSVMVID